MEAPPAPLPVRAGIARLAAALAADSERPGLWLAVAFAAGSGAYFGLPDEPSMAAAWAAALAAFVLIAAMAWQRRVQPLALVVAFLLLGAVAGKTRVAMVDTRLLQATTGVVSITATVAERERLGGRWRVVLDVEAIEGIRAEAIPGRVRITTPARTVMERGDRVRITARLYPLRGPVAPGAWNPARDLWFEGIGATGYALGEAEVLDKTQPGSGWGEAVERLRDAIAARIRAVLPKEEAGLAIALLVGERGEIPSQARDDLRASGLAHILAISGLHMSLVAGGIFWVVRALLALSPTLATGYAIKKWSALMALAAAASYLVLSGASVATQRAFVMVAVMGVAVLLDRPALTMRNLAVAAFAVMIVSPQAVTGASFQMSFLAVACLIAFYEAVSVWRRSRGERGPAGPAWMRGLRWAGLFIAATAATTLVAGTATGLPAASHFHRLSLYSLLANVLGLPAVSLIVMPAGVIAVFAMPFGLEAGPLWLMGKGIEAVTLVAHQVAGLPGANRVVPSFSAVSALVMGLGILWLALWRGRVRLLGLGIFALGLALAPWKSAPDVLVDRFGGVVALRNSEGVLVPSSGRKARYVVEQWLLADGDDASAAEAARRTGWTCDEKACRGAVGSQGIIYLIEEAAASECDDQQIVIAAFPLRGRCRGAPVLIDRFDVWRNGSHAIFIDGDENTVATARQNIGNRPWNVRPVSRRSILADPPPEEGDGEAQ